MPKQPVIMDILRDSELDAMEKGWGPQHTKRDFKCGLCNKNLSRYFFFLHDYSGEVTSPHPFCRKCASLEFDYDPFTGQSVCRPKYVRTSFWKKTLNVCN